ncbi:MAG: ABC transporter ATP-binding protein [Oscillospiraceae bacterium]|nr:ABC transporter ATP-binding protein [Oscillospiraceae bacterium]
MQIQNNSDIQNKGSKTVISMKNIIKRYYIGLPNELQILNGISLDIKEGEFVAIVGESGSGKSTLMNMIGALDRPTEGSYLFNNEDISKFTDRKLSLVRNQEIGFVFQNFNLIPRTSAVKNVELPMMYAGVGRKERNKRAMELLELVGMKDRADHKPNELSGGQKQRVAIARAMANDPSLILADEPTGALDTKTGHIVMDIFHKLHHDGKTIVLITHSPELAKETQRIITISDGNVISDTKGVGR